MKRRKCFSSYYLFKKQRTNSIPIISTDESRRGGQLLPNSYSEQEGDLEVEASKGLITAHINVETHQLTGESRKRSEQHGNVPLHREYPNRERDANRDPYPFATYETAELNDVEQVHEHN